MLELNFSKALVIIHGSVADELDLRDTADGFQIRMEDGLLGLAGLIVAVTVILRGWVESLRRRSGLQPNTALSLIIAPLSKRTVARA